MVNTCEKCGREYVTGQDNVPHEDNEFAIVKVTLSVHLSGGYKSNKVTEEYFEDSDQCAECAKEIYDLLSKTYVDWLYKKE